MGSLASPSRKITVDLDETSGGSQNPLLARPTESNSSANRSYWAKDEKSKCYTWIPSWKVRVILFPVQRRTPEFLQTSWTVRPSSKINVKTKVSHKIHTETVLGNFGDYMASFVCNCGDCSSFLGLTADHKGCNSEDHRLNITSHFTTMCD